jgi:hypothetical protein
MPLHWVAWQCSKVSIDTIITAPTALATHPGVTKNTQDDLAK